MTQVFQCDVWRLDSPSVHQQVGEIVDVGGELMVRVGHGAIVPAGRDQWHESMAAAKRAAAAKVDSMIVQMIGLAARLRAEADAETARTVTSGVD